VRIVLELAFFAAALVVAPLAIRWLDDADARRRIRQWDRERNPPGAE
jgi:hypothetical protein